MPPVDTLAGRMPAEQPVQMVHTAPVPPEVCFPVALHEVARGGKTGVETADGMVTASPQLRIRSRS